MIPEGRGTSHWMTITENLQMGAYTARRQGVQPGGHHKVFSIFRAWRLKAATSLPARCRAASSRCWRWVAALMARQRCCCSTSPRCGLSPIMVDKIFEVVNDIHKQGVTMLLVEQNASRAPAIGRPRL